MLKSGWLAKPTTKRETIGAAVIGFLAGGMIALVDRFLLWPALRWFLEQEMRLLDRLGW
jgi:hypothetical protein